MSSCRTCCGRKGRRDSVSSEREGRPCPRGGRAGPLEWSRTAEMISRSFNQLVSPSPCVCRVSVCRGVRSNPDEAMGIRGGGGGGMRLDVSERGCPSSLFKIDRVILWMR